jgi:hypothetical protein
MKKEWGRELYASYGKFNERNAVSWFGQGIWKLRGLRKGMERGRCHT